MAGRSRFQRRHYETIAEILSQMYTECRDMFERATVDAIRDRFVITFTADNPSFSPSRFRSACEDGVPNARTKG